MSETGPKEAVAAQDYWAIVRREFFRRKLPVVALVVVLMLALLALFAPLLANDKPLIARYKGQLRFPAFTTYLDVLPLPPGMILSLRRNVTFFAAHWPELEGKTWKEAIVEGRSDVDFTEQDPLAAPLEKATQLWHEGSWGWAILAPVPYGFDENNSKLRKLKPGAAELEGTKHLWGTDELGRDVLARMLYGTIVSMTVGLLSVSIYCLLGVIIGALAGYFGGWVDLVISRIIEVVICFPTLFLILAIAAVYGNSIYFIILSLGLIRWTGPARLIRAEFLKVKGSDYAIAAKSIGLKPSHIIFRHLVPNCLAPVLVTATFGVAGAILVESSLSFLGFGVVPPMASWGEVGQQGRAYVSEGLWHLIVLPGLATFIAVTAFNMVGEGVRDAMDPRLKR